MTQRQQQVLKALQAGGRLWRYSTSNTGYLYGQTPVVRHQTNSRGDRWLTRYKAGDPVPVRRCVIRALEDARLIEEDFSESTYRPSGAADIVYKLCAT
jgi:hypothetical protein